MKKYDWTPDKIEELKVIYPNKRTDDIAKHFGFSKYAIYNMAYALKLKKSKEFLSSKESGRLVKGCTRSEGVRHQFKKGHIPANKGRKQKEYMSKEAIERTKATRFKKGQLPKNTLHDYAITERKDKNGRIYKYIRIGLAKWVPYHRYLWEQHNGPIPKGHNIQFRDGNTLNCEIDNLYMISRSKQMKEENSGSKNLPDGMVALYIAGKHGKDKALIEEIKNNHPQLIKLKRQQILLTREIKEQNESN